MTARPGHSTIRFQQAQPAENAPAIYSIENGGEKGLLVRALDLDGTQMWIFRWAEPIGAASLEDSPTPVLSTHLKPGVQAFIRAVPDTQGGVILQFEDASSHSLLAKLDTLTGKEVWRYASPGWLYRTSTTHYDGTLYIVEMQQSPKPETALVGIDTVSGVIKSRIPFPVSQRGEKNSGCKPGNDHIVEYPSSAGAPLTSEHASVFVEVEVSSSIRDSQPCDRGGTLSINNSLRLVEVKRDGSHEWRTIKQFTYDGSPNSPEAKSVPRAIASEVIPDGQGGVQAAWTYLVESAAPRIEARITRISASEMKEFNLPIPGWGGTRWDPSDRNMVLGEHTTGMAAVGNQVVGYDVVTGAVKWTWRAEQGRVQIIMALAGNGLLVMNRGEVVELDAKGQLSPNSQEVLSKRYRAPVAAEDGDNDQIDADGMTAFRFDYGQFFAIQTPRPPARPSALVAIALGGRLY
ncbi:MAG TPA: PQQ-binding-like beta-propeller repeat protein [Terriglobia bacterium]|nr:PQQ-binding-like beta-propeller repeat protein [Terriglobia bacterium]